MGIKNQTEFMVLKDASTLYAKLSQAVDELQLNLDEAIQWKLLHYLDKLLFWNKTYNLTAISQPESALIKHIIDCLAVVPCLHPGNLLDIGTGAGLPGLIIAICQPERSVTVLDSNQKKIRFIKQMLLELEIHNVNAVASRIERFAENSECQFEVITSRAFSSLIDFVKLAVPMLTQTGCLQAMKGVAPSSEELDQLSSTHHKAWQVDVLPLQVPMLKDARNLVTLKLCRHENDAIKFVS